jgi:hypothetical protein
MIPNIAAGFNASAFANGARAAVSSSNWDLRIAAVLEVRGMLRRFDFALDVSERFVARFLALVVIRSPTE